MPSSTSSSRPLRARPVRAAIVLALIAGTLVASEVGARGWGVESRAWYPAVVGRASDRGPDVLVVGTSQSAAAIDEDLLARHWSAPDSAAARVENLGQGFSTTMAHLCAMRWAIGQRPDLLRGTTVLLEAAGGTPPPDGADGRWYYPGMSHLLVPYVDAGLLERYWGTDHTLEEKLELTVRVATTDCALARLSDRVRDGIVTNGSRVVEKVLAPLAPVTDEDAETDLRAKGGVRTDRAGIDRVRAHTLAGGTDAAPSVRDVDWDATLVAELVEFVESHGGNVVFVEVPMSRAAQRTSYASGRPDPARFKAWAERRRLTILRTHLRFDESDFPDLVHLSASRGADFTLALADAWRER